MLFLIAASRRSILALTMANLELIKPFCHFFRSHKIQRSFRFSLTFLIKLSRIQVWDLIRPFDLRHLFGVVVAWPPNQ